jgi:hypothetical protein
MSEPCEKYLHSFDLGNGRSFSYRGPIACDCVREKIAALEEELAETAAICREMAEAIDCIGDCNEGFGDCAACTFLEMDQKKKGAK